MKKIVTLFVTLICILSANICLAESEFDLNKDFNAKFQPTFGTAIGRVVGISTYLSLRERPTVNSRELMRIPNGTKLVLDGVYTDEYGNYAPNQDWYAVQNIFINGKWYNTTSDGKLPANTLIGYVSKKYVIQTEGSR